MQTGKDRNEGVVRFLSKLLEQAQRKSVTNHPYWTEQGLFRGVELVYAASEHLLHCAGNLHLGKQFCQSNTTESLHQEALIEKRSVHFSSPSSAARSSSAFFMPNVSSRSWL